MKPLLETLKAGADFLDKRGVDEARLNMEHLLAHVLQCRRLDLYLRFGEMLDEATLTALRDLVRRRSEGEPLQHLLGTVEFMGREFVSDHRALIPRPETESLTDLLLKRFKGAPPEKVLDLATGSGCIGLSLAAAWKDLGAKVTLSDISEDALDLTRLNATRLGLDSCVRIVRSDLFEKLDGPFDLIVTNLPYVPTEEIPTLSREVRRDPTLALDGGPDGLEVVRRFLTEARDRMSPGAIAALEVGDDQGPTTAALARESGFASTEILQDLHGVPRFVLASTPA